MVRAAVPNTGECFLSFNVNEHLYIVYHDPILVLFIMGQNVHDELPLTVIVTQLDVSVTIIIVTKPGTHHMKDERCLK